jgi:hypothetical protein
MAAVAIVYLGMPFLPLLNAFFEPPPDRPEVLSFQTQVTRIYDDRFIFPFRGQAYQKPRRKAASSKKVDGSG